MELNQKDFISKNFEFAFGQHSGVIDLNKDRLNYQDFQLTKNMEKLIDLNL